MTSAVEIASVHPRTAAAAIKRLGGEGSEMIDAGAVWAQLVIMLGVIALVAITIGASGVYLQRRRRR